MDSWVAEATRTRLPATTRRSTRRGLVAAIDLASTRPAELGEAGTVVLVPGLLASKEDYARVMPGIAAGGHRCLALDLAGQFQSDGPAEPAGYALAELAQDLLDVVAGLDAEGAGPVHVVGHSFGGLVVRAAAIARPDAFRSVVLMGTGRHIIDGTARRGLEALVGAIAQGLPAETIWEALSAMQEGAVSELAELGPGFARERFLSTSTESLVGMVEALFAEPDRTEELRATGVPVLVLAGQLDTAWPLALQQGMAHELGAEMVVVDDAGHSPMLEDPKLTGRALKRWFRRHEQD